jgi:hypothetical protein
LFYVEVLLVVFLFVHKERGVAHDTWTRNKDVDTKLRTIKKRMGKLGSMESS